MLCFYPTETGLLVKGGIWWFYYCYCYSNTDGCTLSFAWVDVEERNCRYRGWRRAFLLLRDTNGFFTDYELFLLIFYSARETEFLTSNSWRMSPVFLVVSAHSLVFLSFRINLSDYFLWLEEIFLLMSFYIKSDRDSILSFGILDAEANCETRLLETEDYMVSETEASYSRSSSLITSESSKNWGPRAAISSELYWYYSKTYSFSTFPYFFSSWSCISWTSLFCL